MDTDIKVFRVSKGNKVLVYVCCALLIVGCASLIFYQLLWGGGVYSVKVISLSLLGLAGGALGVCGIISVLKSRLELLSDRIRVVGMLKNKEYSVVGLKGFRVRRIQGVTFVELISASGKKVGNVELNYDGIDEIGRWIESKLENLDIKDLNSEVAEILKDATLGNTEEERKGTLRLAWSRAKYLNNAAVACMLWGVMYPKPYKFCIFAALLLPLVGFGVTMGTQNVFKLDGDNKGARPVIFPVLAFPALMLSLRAMIDWQIVDWSSFWEPFLICSIGIFVGVYAALSDVRKKFTNAIIVAAFSLIYSYGAVLGLNGLLDTEPPARYQTTIYRKYTKAGKHTEYYFAVSRVKGLEFSEDIQVGRKVYNSKSEGEMAMVSVFRGRFGIPWVEAE